MFDRRRHKVSRARQREILTQRGETEPRGKHSNLTSLILCDSAIENQVRQFVHIRKSTAPVCGHIKTHGGVSVVGAMWRTMGRVVGLKSQHRPPKKRKIPWASSRVMESGGDPRVRRGCPRSATNTRVQVPAPPHFSRWPARRWTLGGSIPGGWWRRRGFGGTRDSNSGTDCLFRSWLCC